MALRVPSTLSPSKLASFTGCGLQFRFSTIERLPEAPSLPAVRGTLVHAALEQLFTLPAPDRTSDRAPDVVDAAVDSLREDPEWAALDLDADAEASLRSEALGHVERYFALEDPRSVQAIGLELALTARVGDVTVRGIIDRLDLVDGELVVTDYKTGRAPGTSWTRPQMTGVHLYALMCEQHFGRRPIRVQLLHLAEPVAIVAEPSAQSTSGLARRVEAIWDAIAAACERDDFRPRRSSRCDWCSYRSWCPEFGGDPARAAADLAPVTGTDGDTVSAVDAPGQLTLTAS